jgi:photosystem II stability/assembly factor-like uncharacterized protein
MGIGLRGIVARTSVNEAGVGRARALRAAQAAATPFAAAAACLVLLGAVAPAAQAATPRYDPPTAPLVLRAGQTLGQQFGYSPHYVRNVPDFNQAQIVLPDQPTIPVGTPFIRSRGADLNRTSFVQTLVGGTWQRFGMLSAVRAWVVSNGLPAFTTTINAAGWDNQHVVFDTAGHAYTVFTIQLADGKQYNLLLSSADGCRNWSVAKLPSGEVTTELWTGHDQLDGPPFVLTWRLYKYHPSRTANYEYLYVTQPYWNEGQLIVPNPIQVTRNCFGVSAHSGGGSLAVTHGGKTFFVWGEIDNNKKDPGSPIYVAEYDHATRVISSKVLLGWTKPRNDEHNTPAITVDSQGYLHVVLGAHNGQLYYYRSQNPDTIVGWNGPYAIPGAVGATYVGLVCDQNDTLHIVYRQSRQHSQYPQDPAQYGKSHYGVLAYQQLLATSAPIGWSAPSVLIYPAGSGYTVYYQKLTIDPFGRLWLTASNLSGAELTRWRAGWRSWRKRGRHGPRPPQYLHSLVMTCAEGGTTWHLASDADFAPPAAQQALVPASAVVLTSATRPAAVPKVPSLNFLKTGLGTWQWLAPRPQGNDISGVWFTDKASGWAVGDAGTILHTTDGGSTWQVQASHTSANLYAVQFVDAKNGWVVGDHGLILHTSNGGKTWKLQRSRAGSAFFAVSFIDGKTGLAVGDNGLVAKTTNGGKVWRIKNPLTNVGLYGVAFVDKDHAWAVGDEGTIVASIDGGKSWKAQYPQVAVVPDAQASRTRATPRRYYPNLYGVWFTSPKVGFAVGESSNLVVTHNGGKSWSIYDIGTASTLYSVRFANAKVGWAVGTGGQILRTLNGGRSWRRQTSRTTLTLLSVACASTARAWVAGQGGTLRRTVNGGGAWSATGGGDTADLEALVFQGSRGWAAGTGGVVRLTANAGKTWTTKKIAGSTIRSLSFVDQSSGWAAGDGGLLLHTSNGGSAWTTERSGTEQNLNGIDVVDGVKGWAVGDDGTILHTADGGANWAPQTSGVTVDLDGVWFANAAEGWAVGGDAWGEDLSVILHTTDGGATWSEQATGGWGQLRAVAFSTPYNGSGWAVGTDWGSDADTPQAVIYRTADGGATWTPKWLGLPGGLDAVVALDASTAVVSGDAGIMRKTTDGGATWKTLHSGTGNDLRALSFVSATVGYAAGEKGTLLMTTRGGR